MENSIKKIPLNLEQKIRDDPRRFDLGNISDKRCESSKMLCEETIYRSDDRTLRLHVYTHVYSLLILNSFSKIFITKALRGR